MNKLYNCLNGLKQLCSIEQMNAFLWATLLYFDAFLEHKRAASNENVSMTGYVSICNLNAWWDLIHAAWLYMLSALGKDARVTLKKSQKKVEQAKVNFGEAYSVLVLGLGHRKSHHTHRGRYQSYPLHFLHYNCIKYCMWLLLCKVEGLENNHRSTFIWGTDIV